METVLRVVIIYVVIVLGLRVMGKREFAQLSPLELVLLLLVPEIASQSLVREDFSLTNGIIALLTLFALVFLTSLASYHSRKFSFVVEGTPSVLIEHGRLVTGSMNRQRIDAGELFSEMHKSGLQHLSEVEWAILETDGRISFVPVKSAFTPQVTQSHDEQAT